MKLEELVTYAEERYHVKEEHNWPTRPGISGLRGPDGHWVAFLIRYWDDARGRELELCDMKCGRQVLTTRHAAYLTFPFLVKGGYDWLGIRFDTDTNRDVVFRLFDWAMLPEAQQRVTVVIPPAPSRSEIVGAPPVRPEDRDAVFYGKDIPQKILEMIHLCRYGSSSFRTKCENFVRQGQFMADYTDDQPWSGIHFQKYFPTYHDMNIRQLRGYFSWRTQWRKGNFEAAPVSMAYVYLYELLNGIGVSSAEESLAKMAEFEKEFLGRGWGDAIMRVNLQRWEMEFGIVHGVVPDIIAKYAAPDFLKEDRMLSRLREPAVVNDTDLLEALLHYGAAKTADSPVLATEKGRHLFAAAWREGAAASAREGKNLFADCFGSPVSAAWYPLSNAVVLPEKPENADYVLDPVRSFHCAGGKWTTLRYERPLFKKEHFQGFLHETDRMLRKYLKTKHYLRAKPEEAWAAPYVEAAIRADEAAEEEVRRPKVTIDFSSLGKIRTDAIATAESLLTDEEKAEAEEPGTKVRETVEPKSEARESVNPTAAVPEEEGPLTPLQREILGKLLKGEPVGDLLKAHFLMPSIVADEINEVLFDEIGDSVVESDGDSLSLVEDYRDDIERLLGGKA